MSKQQSRYLLCGIIVLAAVSSSCKNKGGSRLLEAGEHRLRVHYHSNESYEGWGLHLWNENADQPAIDYAETGANDWNNPIEFTGADEFGAYVDVKVIDISRGLNFLVHKGDHKDLGDRSFPKDGVNEFWLIAGFEGVLTRKPDTTSYVTKATMIEENIIEVEFSELKQSSTQILTLLDANGNEVARAVPPIAESKFQWSVPKLSLGSSYQISYLGQTSTVLFSFEMLQSPKFYYSGDDLGATLHTPDLAEFKLWSIPASRVEVVFFDSNEVEIFSKAMTKGQSFVWHTEIKASQAKLPTLDGLRYRYRVGVGNDVKETLDPYAKSMAATSQTLPGFGVLVSTGDKRAGFRPRSLKSRENPTKMIAYEIHVRDFTVGATDIDSMRRGTFLGFIEKIPYLKDLGVTHVQLLPITNFFNVDEQTRKFQGTSEQNPNYNWGYDPHSYFSLEGWYSSNARDPYARIREFRQMVDSLHEAGIGVIVDVVFNHTVGNFVLEPNAPNFYYRKSDGPFPVGDPPLETRSPMVRKLLIDSLRYMVETYNVDGFRFDLMGFIDSETLRRMRQELGSQILLYGEAWHFTDLPHDESPKKGSEHYPYGIHIGAFNDTIRDGVSGHMSEKGFVQGNFFEARRVRSGIVAGIQGFDNLEPGVDLDRSDYSLFTRSPSEAVNYLSIHDGFTLWDKINLSYRGDAEKRALLVKQAIAILMTSQGRIVFEGGMEMGRTKPKGENDPEPGRAHTSPLVDADFDLPGVTHFHENSYKSSDYTNQLRWDRLKDPVFQGIYDFTKELIHIREKVGLFSLASAEEIKTNLRFLKSPPQMIVFMIRAPARSNAPYSKVLIVHHSGDEPGLLEHDILQAKNSWELIVDSSGVTRAPKMTTFGWEIPPHASLVFGSRSPRE